MNERISTSDFLATGERREDNSNELERHEDVIGSSGGGGAKMVREPDEERAPLFAESEAQDLRARWDRIQIAFVDEPHRAVEDADNLVATTMSRLAEVFSEQRKRLEGERESDDTENLRVALRKYRSFFNRLLSV